MGLAVRPALSKQLADFCGNDKNRRRGLNPKNANNQEYISAINVF